MRSADRHFRPHRKPDSTQLTLYSMINSSNHSSSTPAALKRTRVSGSVGVQNKTELRFPTARKGIGHVKLGRKRRRRRGSRKRRRSRGRRMVSVCSDTFVDGPSVTVHNDRGSVSDHSGADLGSGADPGPARVPGHQRGRSPGGECIRFGEPASVDRLFERIDQVLEGCGRPRPPSPHLWFSLQVSWRTTNTPRR